MFTGLVEGLGTVEETSAHDDRGFALWVEAGEDLGSFEVGESIAVDGVCLTAEGVDGDRFRADVSRETADKTTLGALESGDRVHLERALRAGDRLGGHFVQGHVDGVGRIVDRQPDDEAFVLTTEAPDAVASYLAPKGSIALDGVSLTVNEVDGARFTVTIVPHTGEVTRLDAYRADERVNLEADILAKYADTLLP
ncbi:MAG: riboflavin synthase [Bradymonadaceae bacterium]